LPDVVASLFVLASAAAASALYLWKAGVARHPRVLAEGSSPFLGQRAMQAAYWALWPLGDTLVRLRVSANAITATSLMLGAGASVALATGHFGIGACLAATSAIGDTLDGLVARQSSKASDAGEVLDAAVDRYTEFLFLSGLAVHYRESTAILSLVLLALLGSFMVSYATSKAEALRVSAPRGFMRRTERATYLTFGAALAPLVATVRAEWMDAPVVGALLLVGVVANVSAALRFERIAALVSNRCTVAPDRSRDELRQPAE
jgi:phosphatidylglycerophosphate synthase